MEGDFSIIKHILNMCVHLWWQYPNTRDIISTLLFSNISLFSIIKYYNNKKYHKFKKKIGTINLKIQHYQAKLNRKDIQLQESNSKLNKYEAYLLTNYIQYKKHKQIEIQHKQRINKHKKYIHKQTEKMIKNLQNIIKAIRKADRLSNNYNYMKNCEIKYVLKNKYITKNHIKYPDSLLSDTTRQHIRFTINAKLYMKPVKDLFTWCNNLNNNKMNVIQIFKYCGNNYVMLINHHKRLFTKINSEKRMKVCYHICDEIKKSKHKGDNKCD